jgi:hypothetical protein
MQKANCKGTKMSTRAIAVLIFAALSVRGELPEGMPLSTAVVRVDTVAFRPVPRQVPTQELDSADSASIMKARLEQFDRRRWWKK